MTDTIYLLDFRHGTVQEVDNSAPPEGLRGPAVEASDPRPGYSLETLGSPSQASTE